MRFSRTFQVLQVVKNVRLLPSHPSGTSAGYLRWESCTFQLQKAGTQGRGFVFLGMKHPDPETLDLIKQPPDQARSILIRCQRSGKWMTQNVMTA